MFPMDVLWFFREINRLISKEMSIIYIKVTIEKNWHSENFDFLGLEIHPWVSFWETCIHADIIEF